MNIDIDTTTTPPVAIADDIALTNLVHEAASLQLTLNAAEARMQAHVEAAKKGFEEATREQAQRIAEIFAGIEAYCAAHRDRLFPLKGKTRAKTFAILQHKLQYRSSEAVEAPKDAVQRIQAMYNAVELELSTAVLTSERERELQGLGEILTLLLRWREPELNKDNAKALDGQIPEALGIRVTTSETFKLAFNFTPEQA